MEIHLSNQFIITLAKDIIVSITQSYVVRVSVLGRSIIACYIRSDQGGRDECRDGYSRVGVAPRNHGNTPDSPPRPEGGDTVGRAGIISLRGCHIPACRWGH